MTLPTEWIFPLNEERLLSGDPRQIGQYLQELITTLTSMYSEVSQATNGDIREYIPKIFGFDTPGDAVYTQQGGWVLRQGLMVDVWYALTWESHTGIGDAVIQLPYKVKNSILNVFSGTVNGKYNYTGGYTNMFSLASPNTFMNKIFIDGPANIPFIPLQITTTGQLIGHIRYIGQEIEN